MTTSKGELNGTSRDAAVPVPFVPAEYEWLHQKYPGFSLVSQTLEQIDGKPFDVLRISTADGVERDVWFDISPFYGKDEAEFPFA